MPQVLAGLSIQQRKDAAPQYPVSSHDEDADLAGVSGMDP